MAIPYDVATVGGGLAGSTLAKCLAEHGYRVLVLERETRFRDRVRGEQMHPWDVAEARTFGIYQRLSDTCGHQTRWWTTYEGPRRCARGTWRRRRLTRLAPSISIIPTCRKRCSAWPRKQEPRSGEGSVSVR